MKCIKCGNEIPENSKYCPICGQKNDRTPNFCLHCGSKVTETMRFCENCGKPIEKLPMQTEENKEIFAPSISDDDVIDISKDMLEELQKQSDSQTQAGTLASAKASSQSTGDPTRSAAPPRGDMPFRAPHSARSEGDNDGQTVSAEQTQSATEPQETPVAQEQPAAFPAQSDVADAGQITPQESGDSQTVPPTPGGARTARRSATGVQTAAQGSAQNTTGSAATKTAASVGSAAVSTGAQVASAGARVASAGAIVGAEVVRAAGNVAVEATKKSFSVAKTAGTLALVVAFLIGALAACLNFFVSPPEDTVQSLFDAMEELDYEKMLGCMDKKTESTIRAAMGITGDLLGSFTGINIDLEDLMAFAPSMAPSVDTPDLGVAEMETVFYSDCSQKKIMDICVRANSGEFIPEGYDSDNAIINFLNEYNLTLPGLENLIAKSALVKLTLKTGEVAYFPLINEGWGDWRIPLMDLANTLPSGG